MPSKPVLSDADKKAIRKKLEELCEECWIAQGYKKTSIKNLCDKAVISIGTFYTLYPTKEDLFLETITDIQRRLTEKIIDINRNSRTKEGFAQSMKRLFREYDSKPFLYNVNTPDFQSFVTKLPEETIKKIKFDSFDFFRQVIHAADLNLKMEEAQAYGILSALLSTINAKETLSVTCNSSKVITNEPKKMPPCFGCPARNARRKIRVFHRRMKSSRLPCQSYSAAPGL